MDKILFNLMMWSFGIAPSGVTLKAADWIGVVLYRLLRVRVRMVLFNPALAFPEKSEDERRDVKFRKTP